MSARAFHAPTAVLLDAAAPGVRPLRHWCAAECRRLHDAVHELHQAWARDWHLDVIGSAASAAPMHASDLPRDPLQWRRIDAAPSSNLWWAFACAGARAPTQLLRAALFNEARPVAASNGPMADRLVQSAWQAWHERLCALFGGSAAPAADADAGAGVPRLPETLLQPWSGALVCELSWCGEAMRLAVGGDCVARWLGDRSSLAGDEAAVAMPRARSMVPVWQAMRANRLPLSVELDPVEIDLATLCTLRVGDVLRTAHGLETALRVRPAGAAPGDASLCDAFLGRHGSARAVELLPARPSTTRTES